ncbi:hypothetical protein [Chitinophaga caeni]|uniref:hypothetical protein n=1 Tax=Chitinophaga caeni TaxID=2029983 RepID=UPI0012FDC302|nr:hypothetical protein [Chitinophaga caeni]
MLHSITSSRIAGAIAFILGFTILVFSFFLYNSSALIIMGGSALLIGIASTILSRRTTFDLQLSVAGIIFACITIILGIGILGGQ